MMAREAGDHLLGVIGPPVGGLEDQRAVDVPAPQQLVAEDPVVAAATLLRERISPRARSMDLLHGHQLGHHGAGARC